MQRKNAHVRELGPDDAPARGAPLPPPGAASRLVMALKLYFAASPAGAILGAAGHTGSPANELLQPRQRCRQAIRAAGHTITQVRPAELSGRCEKVPADKSFAEIIAFMIGCIIVKEQTIRGSVMSDEERKLGCHWQRFLSISFSLRNFTQEIIWDSGMRGPERQVGRGGRRDKRRLPIT